MIKRLFDMVFSLTGLFVLAPVFILISVIIKIDTRGPVFFRQVRVGRYGNNFRIHKFRTMYVESELKGLLTVGSDYRVTRCGKFLRKTKLDELPQLIDVFLGNMSLVGPRPEVPEFMDFYPANIRDKVLSVRPGITDKASIEMVDENEILANYDDPRKAYIDVILPIKQAYYIEYVESHNLWLDIEIILLTLKKIVLR
ncbi:MAG: sugar transferase [Nitrincola lacisaponensis]|uniref:sugar transferase n=1 Tax=Nitrincola lacisaponensis TaxID=267850 RepID=UPI003919A5D5